MRSGKPKAVIGKQLRAHAWELPGIIVNSYKQRPNYWWPTALAIIICILIYLPTIWFTPAYIYLIPIAIYFVFVRTVHVQRFDYLIVIYVFCCVINNIAGIYLSHEFDPAITVAYELGIVLVIAALLISRYLNQTAIRFLVGLTTLEALVSIGEFVTGHPVLTANQVSYVLPDYNTNLLYFYRCMGLSANASVAAEKFLFGILLLVYLWDSIKYRWIMLFLLNCGMIVTFNRTALIALAIFYLLLGWRYTVVQFRQNKSIGLLGIGVLVMVATGLTIAFWGTITDQLFRGSSVSAELETGRGWIWSKGLEFLERHPLMGNYSREFRILDNNFSYHMHNSFLEILTTNGVIIGSFYIAFVFLNIRRNNYMYVVPIIVLALGQYAIGWHFSYFDVVFFYMLSIGIEKRQIEFSDGADRLCLEENRNRQYI